MDRATKVTRLLRGSEVDRIRGHARTRRYEDIRRGLLPPPVARSARDKRYPEDEIAALQALEIAGASEDERRALVTALVAARQARAS
jgi:predicted DNA-binding transcriptional regulator AlpA